MLSYRIIATHHGDDIICRAQIHAWDAHDKTWAWQPVHSWSLPSPADADLSTVLSHNLATNGWQAAPDAIPPDPPGHHPRRALRLCPGPPAHHRAHRRTRPVQERPQERRRQHPREGQPGHISTTEISRITGLSRAQLTTYRRTPTSSTDSSGRP